MNGQRQRCDKANQQDAEILLGSLPAWLDPGPSPVLTDLLTVLDAQRSQNPSSSGVSCQHLPEPGSLVRIRKTKFIEMPRNDRYRKRGLLSGEDHKSIPVSHSRTFLRTVALLSFALRLFRFCSPASQTLRRPTKWFLSQSSVEG
jgi:hypothetical protein